MTATGRPFQVGDLVEVRPGDAKAGGIGGGPKRVKEAFGAGAERMLYVQEGLYASDGFYAWRFRHVTCLCRERQP